MGKSTQETASYLDGLCDVAGVKANSVGVECRVFREKTYMASWDAECYEYAVAGFAIYIWLPLLFEANGPLHDPRKIDGEGRVVTHHLNQDDWRRARIFARKHLAHCLFPPTVAIEANSAVYGFWRLRRPYDMTDSAVAAVEQAQQQIKRFLHAGLALPLDATLPMPLLVRAGSRPRAAARLLWARPDMRYELDHLRERCQALSTHLNEPGVGGGRSGHARPPAMLEVRTLPEGWTLEDLEVAPALRKLCHPDSASMESLWRKWVPALVRNMATHRYGFFDVELVLRDPRFGFSQLANFTGYTQLGLRRIYRQALPYVSEGGAPRLPYGIRRIVPLRGEGEDTKTRRYSVEGGSRCQPFSFDVTFETLISARAFRTELGRQLGVLPYPVSRRAWEALLGVGLRDPRIRRWQPESAARPRPLTELVDDYAAQASDWEARPWSDGEPEGSRWPLHRDGRVLFPLKHLRRWLEERSPGEAPRQKEVTAAVRALGGGVHGTARLGPGEFTRCWFLPYPGGRGVQGRA